VCVCVREREREITQKSQMAKEQSLVSIVATQDELCNWEFINQSDFEDDDCIYDIEFIDLLDSLSSGSDDPEQEQEGPTEDLDAHDDDDDAMMGSPPTNTFDEVSCARVVELGHDFDGRHDNFSNYASGLEYSSYRRDCYDDGLRNVHDYDDDDDVNGESDDGDGGYDVDDELVPWEVKDRFERQRMRKLGKRAFAKMTKSKKSAYIYTRPGCVRGKHGLGLKAY